MQSHLIALRTTAVGALCSSGAVASCVGFGQSSAWLPYAIIAACTLIMWTLGRTLQTQLLEAERIAEVTHSHAVQMQDCTEAARVMAASVADRALAESERIRNNRESATIAATNTALTDRALATVHAVLEELAHAHTADAANEELCVSTAATLRQAGRHASAAHRAVLNAALDAARAGKQDPALAAATTAVEQLTRHCGEAAQDHAAQAATLAYSERNGLTAMAAARTGVAQLASALTELRQAIGTAAARSTSTDSAADALAALCVDARYIEHELCVLQGAPPVDDIGDYELPPDPLDWDELDAQVQRDVRTAHETGNIAVLDEL